MVFNLIIIIIYKHVFDIQKLVGSKIYPLTASLNLTLKLKDTLLLIDGKPYLDYSTVLSWNYYQGWEL